MYDLHCLGEATLRSPSGRLVHFRSRKHFALLAYLALNADRAHRRERLAGLLWSDSDDSKARHSLSQALYAVRRLLDGAVHIEGEDLELRLDNLRVDAIEMERKLDAGEITAAADLYRGEFLEGFWVRGAHGFEEWAARERSRVSALARDAFRKAIKLARDRCDWAEARQRAERLVDLDPFDEASYGELMRALWMMGDRAAALDRYDQLVGVLKRELDTGPSRETMALAERIRQRPVRGGWTANQFLRESSGPLFIDPPFVGRKKELAILAAEWDHVATGESRTAALIGAAGIGKTRLAHQYISSLALSDATVMSGSCYEAEQTLPYGPIAEALRKGLEGVDLGHVNPVWLAELARIIPEIRDRYGDLPEPSVLDAEGSRRRLYEGIAQVLRGACELGPVLLFIDDLHWADDSSLALLHYLNRRVTNGLFLLTAHRPEELAARDSAGTTDLLWGGSTHVRTVRVGGLGRAASAALMRVLLGEAADEEAGKALQEMSGGNPFFAIELVRSVTDNGHGSVLQRLLVPESIRSLLERRFAGLTERSIAFLQQAACLGARTSFEALSAAVELPPLDFAGVMRELTRAEILVEEEGVIRFRHNLLREVAWSQVPVALRGALHLRAARALIRAGGGEGEIALHFRASGDTRRAHAYALSGAKAAEAVFALEEAADLLVLAIETAPREVTRLELVGRLGKLYLHLRDYGKARPLLQERLDYVRTADVPELEVFEARRDLLFVDVYSSKLTVKESGKALQSLYREIRDCELNSPTLDAQILCALFWAAARSFDPNLAENTIAKIRHLHRSHREPSVRCRTGRSLGIYYCYKGKLERAYRLLRAALRNARLAEDEAAVVDCYVGLTTLLPRTLSSELAGEALAKALPLASQLADPARITSLLCNCAACYMYLGKTEQASALLSQASDTLQTHGDVPDVSPSVLYNQGFVAHTAGDTETANSKWRAALTSAQSDGVLSVQEECLAALGNLALGRKDIQEARHFAVAALRLARRGQFLLDERFGLAILLAKLEYISGRRSKGLRKLEQATSVARQTDCALYLAAQLARLEMLMHEKKKSQAQEIMQAIVDVAGAKEATWWIEQAEAVYQGWRRPSVWLGLERLLTS